MKKLGINFWRITFVVSLALNIFLFFARRDQIDESAEISKLENFFIFKINEIKIDSLAVDFKEEPLLIGKYYCIESGKVVPVKKKTLKTIKSFYKGGESLFIRPFSMLDDSKNEIFSGEALLVHRFDLSDCIFLTPNLDDYFQ